jgi:hypothetical protein
MTADAPNLAFDAAALKRHFPGLADPQLHYLDNAATAQMPESCWRLAPSRWRRAPMCTGRS